LIIAMSSWPENDAARGRETRRGDQFQLARPPDSGWIRVCVVGIDSNQLLIFTGSWRRDRARTEARFRLRRPPPR
jgi:hypothetical protein